MAIVGFDYGHGGSDPGATYKGRKEADDNLRLGMKTAKIMRANDVKVDETRTTDKTLSLRQRSNFLNKKNYDYVVSFHRNAFNGKARGVEVFAHPNSNIKSKKLSQKMNSELVKLGFINRGAKTANFHMLREVRAYAVLPEVGFIDNPADNKFFDDNIDKIAETIAKSLLAKMGLTYKGNSSSSLLRNGSKGSSVKKLQQDLIALGHGVGSAGADGLFGSGTEIAVKNFQKKYKLSVDGIAGPNTLSKLKQLINDKNAPSHNRMYRVVTGSFGERKNAEERIAKLKKAGFESFIDIYDK